MVSKTDIIESLLFASDKPVTLKKLAQIVELTPDEAMAELDALRIEKESIGSIQLIEVAGGWQLATKPQFSTYIRQLRDAPRQRLSRAAFEVLAVVAYRQPVTRSEIEALRGVDCSGPVQFLLEKKLLQFAGRKDAPGRPHLYGTTGDFLDHFGLRDLTDLPSLEELVELNGGALVHGEIHDGDRLFNRGAMKSEEEADAEAEVRAKMEAAAAEAEAVAASETALDGEAGADVESEEPNAAATDTGAVATDEPQDEADTDAEEISVFMEAPVEEAPAEEIDENEASFDEAHESETSADESPADAEGADIAEEESDALAPRPADMWFEEDKVTA